MIRRNAKRVRLGVLSAVAACASVLAGSNAEALSPAVLTIAPGYGGDKTKNGGAGNEQPTVVSVTDAKGDRYVVVIYMSSNVDETQGLDPWQCKCSSVRLSATAPPEIVADQVLLTSNKNTNRPCNHPFAATDGKRIVWAHGHNVNGGNTQTYVQAIDAMCNQLSDTVMISDANSNANQGAPEIRFLSGDIFVAGYYYDGDDDHTYARGITLSPDSSSITATFRIAAVDDNSIGRPAIATYGDRALVCASRGDNRPPEVGVACAWLNAVTGQLYWNNKTVAASDPGNKIYMNQPSLASLGGGRFALQVIESTGQGKINPDAKGGSKVRLFGLAPSDDVDIAANKQGEISGPNVGDYQAHTAIVSGKYGAKGEIYVGVFGAPITGSGPPGISFLSYNSIGVWNALNTATDKWAVGATVADSGKLSNLYGANPGKQGRDFMRGIGDVTNPGAGVKGGWRSEVKSFFALPYAGMRKGEEKNALFLSFVPGELTPTANPTPEPEPPEVIPTPVDNVVPPPVEPSTCACALPGSSSKTNGLSFVGAGILLLVWRRRNGHASS